MPHIAHVRRRGARYQYRRRPNLLVGASEPISLSLRTSCPKVARARAARLSARWEQVHMVFNEAAFMKRKTLTVAEVTDIYKMELNAELGLTIRDYTVLSPDLPKLYRTRSVYAEAYGVAERLPDRAKELPADERERLERAGWSTRDIEAVWRLVVSYAEPANLMRAAHDRLTAMGAPATEAALSDAVHHLVRARIEAQKRAAFYPSAIVSEQPVPVEFLLATSSAQLTRMAQQCDSAVPAQAHSAGFDEPLSGATPMPEPSMVSVFIKPDLRPFSSMIEETIARIVASGDWNQDVDQRRRVMTTFAWVTGDKRLCDYDHCDPQIFLDALRRIPTTHPYGTMDRPFADVAAEFAPLTAENRRSNRTINRDLTILSRVSQELHKTVWRPIGRGRLVLDFAEL